MTQDSQTTFTHALDAEGDEMHKTKRFTQLMTGKWQCNLCGKIVKEGGWLGHLRVHRKESRFQVTLSDEVRSFKHKPTCTCGFCKTKRELSGQ